jgi:hypothetical protein
VRRQRHAPAALYPRQIPGTHCTEGCVGPRTGLNRSEKSRPPPAFDPRTVQPLASRYTEQTTRPTNLCLSPLPLRKCIKKAELCEPQPREETHFNLEQDMQFTYNVTSWSVRVMFIPLRISQQANIILLERERFCGD